MVCLQRWTPTLPPPHHSFVLQPILTALSRPHTYRCPTTRQHGLQRWMTPDRTLSVQFALPTLPFCRYPTLAFRAGGYLVVTQRLHLLYRNITYNPALQAGGRPVPPVTSASLLVAIYRAAWRTLLPPGPHVTPLRTFAGSRAAALTLPSRLAPALTPPGVLPFGFLRQTCCRLPTTTRTCGRSTSHGVWTYPRRTRAYCLPLYRTLPGWITDSDTTVLALFTAMCL